MKKILKIIYTKLLKLFLRSVYETNGTSCPITIPVFFYQKILGINRAAYWPMHFTSKVTNVQDIYVGIGAGPGLSPGCYIQGIGGIYIGDYTLVAPNVGIISANHDVNDITNHVKKPVKIGSYCWIGMNAVVLPGVELGDFTIVGAGSVVTKSFKDGYCIIAGNPVQEIRKLNPEECIKRHNQYEYHGYLTHSEFIKKRFISSF